jgi:ABC-2 type transport system ATP-binding protein
MRETYWSRFADSFDTDQEYVVGKALLDEIDRELQGLPDLGAVVEFGCGAGRFTPTIASKASSMVATDLSDSLLAAARTRLGDRSGITFQKQDCTATSFSPGAFDAVFMANLLHVIESPERALEECHRILGSGGRLVVVSYTGHGTPLWERIKLVVRFLRRWGRPPPHVHWFSPEGLGSMMEEAGFAVQTSRLVGERTKAVYAVGEKGGSDTGS